MTVNSQVILSASLVIFSELAKLINKIAEIREIANVNVVICSVHKDQIEKLQKEIPKMKTQFFSFKSKYGIKML